MNPQLIQIEDEILKIFEECKSQGMSKEEIQEVFSPLGLPAMVDGMGRSHTHRRKNARVFSISKIGIAFLVTLILLFVLSRKGAGDDWGSGGGGAATTIRFNALAILRIALIKILPYWNWTELYHNRCLLRNPFFENIPMDNCNLCENQEEIVRLEDAAVVLVEDYIRREKPFIVIDAMEDWPIMNTDQFWFNNLTEIYLRHDVHQVCNVNSNLRSQNGDFSRLLRKLYNPRNSEWFLHWENCQKEMAKGVRGFYRRPYFVSPSLDFTGPNWIILSSGFKGRVWKRIEGGKGTLFMLYQIRGSNHLRITPTENCRTFCPELSTTLYEGETLVVTNMLWMLEYIPGEMEDNVAIVSEVSWPSYD